MPKFAMFLVFAYCLDLILGDPRWFPHPVRGIGWAISQLERGLKRGRGERWTGVVLVLVIVLGTYGLSFALIAMVTCLHRGISIALQIGMLWTTLAAKDLYIHTQQVLRPLIANDLSTARSMLSRIVGRDTENLDSSEIVRATVESIAENLVDGITAPMFYALIGGAPAALAYKAANTLDSMVGYKNERYRNFGWASAKFDDGVNFIPARLTGGLIPVVAAALRFDGRDSWRIFMRERKKHPSPNSAHAEAAFAGALNVRLGGTSTYQGVPSHKPYLGEPLQPLTPQTIRRAQILMWGTSVGFLILCFLVSWFFKGGTGW
ncbi:cobalamin biosynthesis protein CobD [Candidatus Poribacteria bacterium]|nr:cobalamin biosynthesis protein CobD [Candidatus Poribacteria bacterium]